MQKNAFRINSGISVAPMSCCYHAPSRSDLGLPLREMIYMVSTSPINPYTVDVLPSDSGSIQNYSAAERWAHLITAFQTKP
jgi:hypothetical protein